MLQNPGPPSASRQSARLLARRAWVEPGPSGSLGWGQEARLSVLATRSCAFPCIPTTLSEECNLLGHPQAAFSPNSLPYLNHTPSFSSLQIHMCI